MLIYLGNITFIKMLVCWYVMELKAKTSLTLNKELWKKFKVKCVQTERQYTDVIEELITNWLKQK
jgi:hypothetical protein